MAQMRDPLGQPLVMPAVEGLVPQAHLHEGDAIHGLEAHEVQKAFVLVKIGIRLSWKQPYPYLGPSLAGE